MMRNQVEDDENVTCAKGLHVCSKEYLPHFGGQNIVACEVDPKDVVSVPLDYNNSKMRVCEYKVVGVITDDSDYMNSAFVNSELFSHND
jgi:hypothetical protein